MFGPKSDDQLIRSALGGSERAWLSLVKRYEKRVYNHCLRMSGNTEDALDILQDVMLSVYRNLKHYRGDGEFAAWLFRIASFRCIDYFRRRKFLGVTDELGLVDEKAANQPELTLDEARSSRDITRLMKGLSLEQRQVVELKFFQNFTFDEIAGQLGISANTAKTRLYAALGKMRRQHDVSLAS